MNFFRPIDPTDIDIDCDDMIKVDLADKLMVIELLKEQQLMSHSVYIPRDVRQCLQPKRNIHWSIESEGLNDTNCDSDSEGSNFFQSVSSGSEPDTDFYIDEVFETNQSQGQNTFYQFLLNSISELDYSKDKAQGLKVGFYCPDYWITEIKE